MASTMAGETATTTTSDHSTLQGQGRREREGVGKGRAAWLVGVAESWDHHAEGTSTA